MILKIYWMNKDFVFDRDALQGWWGSKLAQIQFQTWPQG